MKVRTFFLWLLLPLLGFGLGCVLGFVLPEKEEEATAVIETAARTLPTSAPSTVATLSAQEQMLVDFLNGAEPCDEVKQMDLDGDGVEELLLYRHGDLVEIAAVQADSVVSLRPNYGLFLCENRIIGQYSEGAGGHTAFFHQLKDGQFQTVECLVYHWHEDAWYRSPDFSANDANLVPITEDERMAILEQYPCAEPIDRQILQAIYQ